MTRAPMLREISVDQARTDFDGLVAAIKQNDDEIVLTDAGKAIARIVPSDEPAPSARRAFFQEARRLREAFRDMPSAELEALIDNAVAEVRAQAKSRCRRSPSAL